MYISQNSIKSGGVACAIQWEGCEASWVGVTAPHLTTSTLLKLLGVYFLTSFPSDSFTLENVNTPHNKSQGKLQCTVWLKPESQNHALNIDCEKCNKTITIMVTQHPISAGCVQETLNPRGAIIICQILIFLTSKGWLVTAIPKLQTCF